MTKSKKTMENKKSVKINLFLGLAAIVVSISMIFFLKILILILAGVIFLWGLQVLFLIIIDLLKRK